MSDSNDNQLSRYRRLGIALMLAGVAIAVVGALMAHFSGLPELDDLQRELYPSIPRGWIPVTIAQLISIGGVITLLAGTALAFLYEREMTWARAAVGALLFVGLMIILFGVIPNQWLTLTQATFEWTPQKIAFTIPSWLVLNNEVSISYAAVKDVVSGTYVVIVLGAIAVTMYQWQERQKKAASAPPPQPVSPYGRPLTKVGR